ncbi:MAG: flagellar motor switch protein FliM [Desulfotomaculum sp.]|nr:flagellar motor switch protein FliM [Desulfotomaculum sp.]
MKDVLSQAEIDSLLEGLISGQVTAEDIEEDTEQQKLKTYDFRRPNKFSKEHLRTLHVLHESYARLLTNFLSGLLQAEISIEVASVGQFSYEEFTRSVVSPTLLTVFRYSSHKGNAVLETTPHFLMPLIDLQLGGTGEMPEELRELTEIELSVARKLIGKLLEQLSVIWKDIIKGKPEIVSTETNPHLHQLLSPNDIVLVITFSTNVGEENRGLMNLCLPYNFLEPVLSKFSVNQFSQMFNEREQADIKAVEYWLNASDVELIAAVGNGTITIKDFLDLQVGDVLLLDRQQGQDFDLYVQDQLKFKVQPGRLGNKLAVQVVSLAEEAWELDG